MVPFSVLDLSPVCEGSDAAQSFRNTRDLAQHAERWGYHRFWLAEHHNMPGIASAATAVLIGHVAGSTTTIRVGAGGIMLPNHSPLVIAEQFGTLESLYPGRIDLGLGRAPGGDPASARALRRDADDVADYFPRDVAELNTYFAPAQSGQAVQAVPGAGLAVPIWILGSSLFGAQLAARMGLPYAFASHFAPDHLDQALALYRESFRPSAALRKPYAMIGVNAIAAASDAEANRLFTSQQMQFVNSRRGQRGRMRPPIDRIDTYCSEAELTMVERALACSAVGAPDTVRHLLESIVDKHHPDEVMITGHIFDHASRLRSFEIVSGLVHVRSSASRTP
jgi:luciferase family oxidoreductase group 1